LGARTPCNRYRRSWMAPAWLGSRWEYDLHRRGELSTSVLTVGWSGTWLPPRVWSSRHRPNSVGEQSPGRREGRRQPRASRRRVIFGGNMARRRDEGINASPGALVSQKPGPYSRLIRMRNHVVETHSESRLSFLGSPREDILPPMPSLRNSNYGYLGSTPCCRASSNVNVAELQPQVPHLIRLGQL